MTTLNKKVLLVSILAATSQVATAALSIGDNVHLGAGSTATADKGGIAIGKDSNAMVNHGVAVGVEAHAASSSTAYGYRAQAQGYQSIAMGDTSKAEGIRSTAIGAHSTASGNGSTVVGILSQATGGNSVALGNSAEAKGDYAIAAGLGAKAGTDGTAMGRKADASGQSSIALGQTATASAKDSIALGHNAESTHAGSIALGLNSKADGSTLNNKAYLADSDHYQVKGATAVGELNIGQYKAGEADQYRKISGVAAGSEDTDAVNVSQLKAATAGVQNAVQYAANDKGLINLAGVDGTVITNLKAGDISANSTDAVNGAQLHAVTVDVSNLQNNVNTLSLGLGDVNGRVDQLENKFAGFDKDTKAAISSALAVASLPQPTEKGATMLSVGSGFWDGETGFAVGASGVTEDKSLFNKPVNYVWKFASTSNTRSDWGASTAVGVQWK